MRVYEQYLQFDSFGAHGAVGWLSVGASVGSLLELLLALCWLPDAAVVGRCQHGLPGCVHKDSVMAWQVLHQPLVLQIIWQEATTWLAQILDQTSSFLGDGGRSLTSEQLLFWQPGIQAGGKFLQKWLR